MSGGNPVNNPFGPSNPVIVSLYNGPLGTYANINNTMRPVNYQWDGGRGINYQIPRINNLTTTATLNQIQAWAGSDGFVIPVTNSLRVQIRTGATNAAVSTSGTTIYDTLSNLLLTAGTPKNTGTATIVRPLTTVSVTSEDTISVWVSSNGNGSTGDEFGVMVTWNIVLS